MWYGWLILYI